MKNDRTKGEIEASIRNAILKFERGFMGRGPENVKAFILTDLVRMRLKAVLTPAESQLTENTDGLEMIKTMHQNLISQGREKLCFQVSEIADATISEFFTEIDARIGE